MGYYLHDLPIAVEKFSGEIHFRNTREKRETNRLRTTKNKETNLKNKIKTDL